MSGLQKTRLAHTALGGRVVLARFGADPNVALETRDAQSEFFQTVVSFAFDGKLPAPGAAAEVSFGGSDEQFVMSIRRLDASAAEEGGPQGSWGDPRMDLLEAQLLAVLAASGVDPTNQSSILHRLASDSDSKAVAAAN
ncbi:hypothetical protein V5F40_22825 [Xanthobacter sp. DSM 14520]|uniref:hypothetical protein n=1 Tax=Xanthobacter autotrophicus (strain ATCC BAA-1158 / Py2) TaxID=78245 RepID=UPI0037268076